MKKTILFLFLLLCTISSCKSDKDDVDYTQSVVGSWTFKKISKMSLETNSKLINAQLAQGLKDIDKADYSQYKGYALFAEDGTYKTEMNGIIEEGTYKLDGSTMTTVSTDNRIEKTSLYISGRVLEITQKANKNQIKEEIEKLGDKDLSQQVKDLERQGVQFTNMSLSTVFVKP